MPEERLSSLGLGFNNKEDLLILFGVVEDNSSALIKQGEHLGCKTRHSGEVFIIFRVLVVTLTKTLIFLDHHKLRFLYNHQIGMRDHEQCLWSDLSRNHEEDHQ